MREIDPFAYYHEHESAIRGHGGPRRSPDPNYCFHTKYVEVRPGTAHYILQLSGVRASEGELSVRVHALKPSLGGHASLVTAGRLRVDANSAKDLTINLRFVALPDVHYALYGIFTEYSDLAATGLHIFLDEPEDGAMDIVEPPVSALAMREEVYEVRPANALIYNKKIDISHPVSQDCTFNQLDTLIRQRHFQSHDISVDTAISRWREAVCLNALAAYDINVAGLDGRLLGPVHDDLRETLAAGHLVVRHDADPATTIDQKEDFADFILWPAGPGESDGTEGRWASIHKVFGRLKIGGMAVIGVGYSLNDALMSSTSSADHKKLSRNEIGQWVLRLIGAGYSVAPLAFAEPDDVVVDSDGMVAFAMIVQRR